MNLYVFGQNRTKMNENKRIKALKDIKGHKSTETPQNSTNAPQNIESVELRKQA